MSKKIFLLILVHLFSTSVFADGIKFRINYGIVSHDQPSTSVSGTQTYDNDDLGYIFSISKNLISWIEIEGIYYDFGSNSITGGGNEIFEYDGGNYQFNSSGGTVTRNTEGYGVGFRFLSDELENNFFKSNLFFRLGFHHWDHPGSTDALNNVEAFNPHFYNTGYDLYSGTGIEIEIVDDLKVYTEFNYFSFNDSTFGQIIGKPSTMLSLGVSKNF